jgi:hypothetical protein
MMVMPKKTRRSPDRPHRGSRAKDPVKQEEKAETVRLLALARPMPVGWKKAFVLKYPEYADKQGMNKIANVLKLIRTDLELAKLISEFVEEFKKKNLAENLEKAKQYQDASVAKK